ncbi:MAG: hypothetical protein V3V08_01820 [Nannocystaceae bacterium]
MFGEIACFWGFTRTQGRVYGHLFLSPDPLDQASIRTRLKISAGSASMTLTSLTAWGALQRTGRFYSAQTNLWTLITTVMRTREYPKVAEGVTRLRDLSAQLHVAGAGADAGAELRFMRDRIDHLLRFFDMCRAFLNAIVEHNPVHGILNNLARRAAKLTRARREARPS